MRQKQVTSVNPKGSFNTVFITACQFVAASLGTATGGVALAQTELTAERADFCAAAQTAIAQVNIRARNTLHTSYEAFVESKAVAFPLETQQFYSSPARGDAKLNTVVSCKMKTAGRIRDAYLAAEQTVIVGQDRSCDFLTERMLDQVTSAIDPAQIRVTANSLVVEKEELTFMGPMWLRSWPFQSVYRDESEVLHLKSRALYVPWSSFIPAPAAFKGVYYCHLPSPQYLEALLLGRLQAPPEQ